MNRPKVLVIETDGTRREIRPPQFASDARSQVSSTPETSRNGTFRLNKRSVPLPKLAHYETYMTVGHVRGRFAVGFSEAWRKRSMGSKKNAPVTSGAPGLGASSTRPRPGYPLLGCSPAWPNSVSPGNVNNNSRFACPKYRHKRLPGRPIQNRQKCTPARRRATYGIRGNVGIIVTETAPNLSSCRF